MASEFLGFLIFGILGIVSAIIALIGSIFILQRKRFKISIIGAIFPLVSVIGTYITIQQYAYGFTDTLLFALPTVLILTIMSILLLFKSKNEFTWSTNINSKSAIIGLNLRSEFTVGLTIVSLILLLYVLSSNPLLESIFRFRAFSLSSFAILPDLPHLWTSFF